MFLANTFKSLKNKTYDFRKLKRGVDYFVDFLEANESATITTALTIKPGDKIIVSHQKLTLKYNVEAINYYGNDNIIRRIFLKRLPKNSDYTRVVGK